ncbi:MAG: cobalamin biosynthesis protein CbiD [Leptotrichia sp.]|nr:cobalamin biosynthesis protein CbiD [Leptotrichia sp.]
MDEYLYFRGKKLRYGYTTGSSATAATKAALMYLLDDSKHDIPEVTIKLPSGNSLTISVNSLEKKENSVLASVIKDGGDDPDVTHGLEIYSKVSLRNDSKINIFGGIGVGKVTKKGLPIAPGNSAINPVPLKMIRETVEEMLPEGLGADVEIFVPKGEETAKKTLNAKLGIIGGISILGTTGIVKPMSEESWKASLAIELKMALENAGNGEAIFLFGNRGKQYLSDNFDDNTSQAIVISNFVGYMFDRACEFEVKKIYFIGELGKFVKVAGGIFHTHSRVSDAKMEILTANALLVGESTENMKKIMASNTTEEATKYIEKTEVYNLLAEKAKQKCEEYCRRNGWELEVETLIISAEKEVLGNSRYFFDNFKRKQK